MGTITRGGSEQGYYAKIAISAGEIYDADFSKYMRGWLDWANFGVCYRFTTIASGAGKIKLAFAPSPTLVSYIDDQEGTSTTTRFYIDDPQDWANNDIAQIGDEVTKINNVNLGSAGAATVTGTKTAPFNVDYYHYIIDAYFNNDPHQNYGILTFGSRTSAQVIHDLNVIFAGEATASEVTASGSVTAVSSGGAGLIQYTAAAHGMKAGQEVTLTNFADSNYNGKKTITSVGTNNFSVSGTFTATGTGNFAQSRIKITSNQVLNGYDSKITLVSKNLSAWPLLGFQHGTTRGTVAGHYIECASANALTAAPATGTEVKKKSAAADYIDYKSIGASKTEFGQINLPCNQIRIEATGADATVELFTPVLLDNLAESLT